MEQGGRTKRSKLALKGLQCHWFLFYLRFRPMTPESRTSETASPSPVRRPPAPKTGTSFGTRSIHSPPSWTPAWYMAARSPSPCASAIGPTTMGYWPSTNVSGTMAGPCCPSTICTTTPASSPIARRASPASWQVRRGQGGVSLDMTRPWVLGLGCAGVHVYRPQ